MTGVEDDSFTIRFQGNVYTVSIEKFRLIADDFFATFQRARSARERGDSTALVSALMWLLYGIIGVMRETNPEMPPILNLTERQIEAIGDELYRAAVERAFFRAT